MVSVQIFGIKNSAATRAAERFFKERSIQVQFVDLKIKPMAPGEIKRFIDRFKLAALVDHYHAAYREATTLIERRDRELAAGKRR